MQHSYNYTSIATISTTTTTTNTITTTTITTSTTTTTVHTATVKSKSFTNHPASHYLYSMLVKWLNVTKLKFNNHVYVNI
jgi:hypothetical protein